MAHEYSPRTFEALHVPTPEDVHELVWLCRQPATQLGENLQQVGTAPTPRYLRAHQEPVKADLWLDYIEHTLDENIIIDGTLHRTVIVNEHGQLEQYRQWLDAREYQTWCKQQGILKLFDHPELDQRFINDDLPGFRRDEWFEPIDYATYAQLFDDLKTLYRRPS